MVGKSESETVRELPGLTKGIGSDIMVFMYLNNYSLTIFP